MYIFNYVSLFNKLQASHTKEGKTKLKMAQENRVQGTNQQITRFNLYRKVNFQVLSGNNIITEEEGISKKSFFPSLHQGL